MKRLILLTSIFCAASMASAQGDKVYFGGGFGLNFSSEYTNLSASPLVGYRVTDQFSVGVSVTYQYIKIKSIDQSFNSTGGSLFTRFLFTDEIFAHAEFERLNYDQIVVFTNGDFTETRKANNALLLGGGYRQPMGRNASFSVLGLYDVLWKSAETSPYSEPWQIRAGVAVGF